MTPKTRQSARTASACAAVCLAAFVSAPAAQVGLLTATPGFSSPSGNITCYVDHATGQDLRDAPLVCLIFEATWPLPPDGTNADPDCPLDQTRQVDLPREGPARVGLMCHGDVFWPAPLGRISYGSQWSLGGFRCDMAETGVRCRNDSGDGFTLNRRALERQ